MPGAPAINDQTSRINRTHPTNRQENQIMKTIRLAGIAILTLAASVGVAQAASLEDLKSNGYIRGASANEVPYSFMDENGAAKGIGPDVATAVLKSMGVNEIAWTVTPFGSLIPGLKAKRYDFVAAEMNILPDRCKQVTFTEPNSSYGEGLLVPAGNPKKLHSYEDIKKDPALKVAIVTGADQIDFLHDLGVPDSQIVMIQANADALSTVQTGRADAYAATELTVSQLIKASGKGEYDGNELAVDGSDGDLYMYGPNADKLFTVVKPLLQSSRLLKSVVVTLRYGAVNDKTAREVQVRVGS